MQRITSSKLADLLTHGFQGEVEFSGNVYCTREDKKERSFYESSGKFSLTPAGSNQRVEEGSYLLTNSGSSFYFKPKEGEKIESNKPEKYGDVIAFPIDFPTNATLQIEPREIMY